MEFPGWVSVSRLNPCARGFYTQKSRFKIPRVVCRNCMAEENNQDLVLLRLAVVFRAIPVSIVVRPDIAWYHQSFLV